MDEMLLFRAASTITQWIKGRKIWDKLNQLDDGQERIHQAIENQKDPSNQISLRNKYLDDIRNLEDNNPKIDRIIEDLPNAFTEENQKVLLKELRKRPEYPLPTSLTGLEQDDIDEFVDGLPRRYQHTKKFRNPYPGLQPFLSTLKYSKQFPVPFSKIAKPLTGPASTTQNPNHNFYKQMVLDYPDLAAQLLQEMPRVSDPTVQTALLSGTLAAIRELIDSYPTTCNAERRTEIQTMRDDLASAFAATNVRAGIKKVFNHDEVTELYAEFPVILADFLSVLAWITEKYNDTTHAANRIFPDLEHIILTIPTPTNDWSTRENQVDDSIQKLSRNIPALWNTYGNKIENALTNIGEWKTH